MANPLPNPQDDDPYADRRTHARVAVAMPAFLQAKGERHFVHILDLSAGGAKLKCPVSLTTGTAVTLDCGTVCRPAIVRWQTEGVLGLCFNRELDARDVNALLERSNALATRMKAPD